MEQGSSELPLKTSFNVTMIRNHVDMINNHIKKMELEGKSTPFEFELELLEVFPEFYDAHPSLVKKLCKRDDISYLYKMLDNLQQIEDGKKTLAGVEMNLGNELANKYLYPVVNKK